jgi:sugar O-acyltransferase (sialic acid O-acetyltransferase NeuD family)
MKRLAIIGAGTLGQQIAQHVTQSGTYQVAGFFDDFAATGKLTPNGSVLGPAVAARGAFEQGRFDEVLLGIGYNHMSTRQRLYENLAAHLPFGKFIHPAAYVDPSAKVEAGTFISPGCVLDLNVTLSPNVFLYSGCIVAHDAYIGSHTFLAPGVRMAGHVRVGARCFLGIGTTIIDHCNLGPDVRTGGGTVVTHDLCAAGTYVGVPARRLPGP